MRKSRFDLVYEQILVNEGLGDLFQHYFGTKKAAAQSIDGMLATVKELMTNFIKVAKFSVDHKLIEIEKYKTVSNVYEMITSPQFDKILTIEKIKKGIMLLYTELIEKIWPVIKDLNIFKPGLTMDKNAIMDDLSKVAGLIPNFANLFKIAVKFVVFCTEAYASLTNATVNAVADSLNPKKIRRSASAK